MDWESLWRRVESWVHYGKGKEQNGRERTRGEARKMAGREGPSL
jgi:hypothetical protein